MMKKGVTLFLALLLFLFTLAPMQVYASDAADDVIACQEGVEEGSARSAQAVWYTRTINGVTQKRLWSVTYGYWLTDWIDC